MKKTFILFFAIIAILHGNAQVAPASAKSIIEETCKQAAEQNKKAFILFHASWCGWCKRMDSSMNDASCKKFFDDNYVINHITVLETPDKQNLNNPGGEAFLAEHKADKQGIPAWFILDKDGNVLADSQLRPDGAALNTEGSNVGCPAKDTEINYFISVLEKTSNINNQQKEAVRKRFSLNKITTH